jgi:type IV pilus assembly protein PilY1
MKTIRWMIIAALAGPLLSASAGAAPLSLAQYPLFLTPVARPNVLVIYDNSESMDGTMAGKLIAGDDPTTRGNIARKVITDTLNKFSGSFRWGLESFEYGGWPSLYSTYPYWLGSDTTMLFTDDCDPVLFVSVSNGGLRCINNPQWNGVSVGDKFVTYDRASDDPDINDALYIGYFGTGAWATTTGGGGAYNFWFTHNPGTDFEANMANYWATLSFTPTDAGYIPYNPPITRQLYAYRAWGYLNGPTGRGLINEPIDDSSNTTHFNRLLMLMQPETSDSNLYTEIKNASVFTPLAGSMDTALNYYQGAGGYDSPISLACQRSFVLLATDGNPTSNLWGGMYPLDQQQNVEGPPGTWAFSPAATDVFTRISALRGATVGGVTHDIQTYVVGLGDTVANRSSVAVLNQFAVLGGTTRAYLANDPTALATAFASIAVDIETKTAAAASVSLNTGSWGTGTKIFQARFTSADWSGQLLAYAVNADGSLGSLLWDGGQTINGQDWSSGRRMLTYKPSTGQGIPFRWPAAPLAPTATELDVGEIAALNAADGFGRQRLEYLRGSFANESGTCGTCTPALRPRATSKLGDIVHSAPAYVAAPAFGYPDSMEGVAYSSFVTAKAARRPTVYVGANDGFLHAFDATTGAEVLAYMPSSVYSNLTILTDLSYTSGSVAHHFFVDASPTVGDVFYGAQWHTLLAGGLGAGGQGVYALDVTDPATFGEGNASSIVRWEFTDANDPDLGYVFGQPLLVKTNNGKWSVIVANGYNNSEADGNASTSGHAVLFVLDAQTGAVIRKIDTGVGSAATPNGLSAAVAIDVNGDGVADTVYAGDVQGNMWKFDLSSSTPLSWGVALGGEPLFITSGREPITVRPDVTPFPRGGYMITFGTGSYISVGDNANTDTQRFYGIIDKGATVRGLGSLVHQRVVDTGTAGGNTYRLTTHAVDPPTLDAPVLGDNIISLADYYATKKGWYMTLPTRGERNVTDPAIRGGRVIFNTMIPLDDPCANGGTGWVMEVNVMTGNRYDTPTFDTNGDNAISNADLVSFGATPQLDNTSGRMTTAIPAPAGFLRMPFPSYENKYVNTSSGTVTIIGETSGLGSQGRVSWRQLP